MMAKESHRNLESNRPESGGADRNDSLERSGILDREKEQFAQRDAQRQRSKPEPNDESNDSRGDVGEHGDIGSGEPQNRTFDD